jgi:hypothetical protein
LVAEETREKIQQKIVGARLPTRRGGRRQQFEIAPGAGVSGWCRSFIAN